MAAAAAALEAKSDDKRVQGKKPGVKKEEKKALTLQSRISLGCKSLQLLRTQQLRRILQKRNPPQKRRNLCYKLKFVYSVKVKSLWTANFE